MKTRDISEDTSVTVVPSKRPFIGIRRLLAEKAAP